MKFLIKQKDDDKRLDIFLSEKIDHLTRSNIKKIIESNNVKINEKIIRYSSKKVKTNDLITITFFLKSTNKLLPNKIKLDIRKLNSSNLSHHFILMIKKKLLH